MAGSGGLSFEDIQKMVDEAAHIKSEHFRKLEERINQAIAMQRPKVDSEGKVSRDNKGNIILEDNTIDEKIAAVYSIALHDDKIETINDEFIRRVHRSIMYARVLAGHKGRTYSRTHLRMLIEYIHQDIAVIVKNIIPDTSKKKTSIFPVGSSGDSDDILGGQPSVLSAGNLGMTTAKKRKS